MHDLKALTKEVLHDSYLVALGTADAAGPWVSYVFFISDDDMNIYWISKPATRHSRALEHAPKVSAAFLAASEKDKERALQIEGIAKRIDAPSVQIQAAFSKKRTPDGSYDFEKVLAKGYSWYQLTPSYIGLIHNELFGNDRQQVL